MRQKIGSFMIAALLWGSAVGRADFKYTESGKVTGGMMAGMMKFAAAFSKKAGEPIVTTHMVKSNRLRTESSDGKVQIVDLDGRRIVDLDTQKRTYSVVTFDDMRAALEKMQPGMNQKGMKMTPKFEVTSTTNTKVILGETAREVKVRIDMQVQADDPKQQQQAQSASFTVNSHMWIAPSVRGYKEIQEFHERMSKELNWMPGAVFGGDPKMAQAMLELRKNAATLNGLPLLQSSSIGLAGMPQATTSPEGTAGSSSGGQGTQTRATSEETAPSKSATPETRPSKSATPETKTEKVSNPKDMLTKGIGGMFGGFGKKKKKQETPPQETEKPSAPASTAEPTPEQQKPAAASPGSASLAEITTEVTAFSYDPLDSSLFEIPAGYRQVQEGAEKVLGGKH